MMRYFYNLYNAHGSSHMPVVGGREKAGGNVFEHVGDGGINPYDIKYLALKLDESGNVSRLVSMNKLPPYFDSTTWASTVSGLKKFCSHSDDTTKFLCESDDDCVPISLTSGPSGPVRKDLFKSLNWPSNYGGWVGDPNDSRKPGDCVEKTRTPDGDVDWNKSTYGCAGTMCIEEHAETFKFGWKDHPNFDPNNKPQNRDPNLIFKNEYAESKVCLPKACSNNPLKQCTSSDDCKEYLDDQTNILEGRGLVGEEASIGLGGRGADLTVTSEGTCVDVCYAARQNAVLRRSSFPSP